jgi:hypothetical protein
MADDVADSSLSGTSDSESDTGSESDNLKLKTCPLHLQSQWQCQWQAPSFSGIVHFAHGLSVLEIFTGMQDADVHHSSRTFFPANPRGLADFEFAKRGD